ncbi:MAG: RnfABCDGE type electron transport complex subunit G [Clostridiales bacterium]|nr:RnfABCDGE type electron transport complex subunit G [Clostridiales bacterium]
MKKMLKDAVILFAITLAAGLILGFVYQLTKEPIAAQELKAKQEAYKEVFAKADSFEAVEDLGLTKANDMLKEAGFGAAELSDMVQRACDAQGNTLGYVLTVTTHEGYGGDIVFTMGITKDGILNGISILTISETPGLGMKAESVLKPQFAGKAVEQFTYTKSGATTDSQIDAISGATITTNAMTNGVNAGLFYFRSTLQEGGKEE